MSRDCENCGNALYRNGAHGPCTGCTDFNKWEPPQVIPLPDGSAFSVVSLPLPNDHWIYEAADEPPAELVGYESLKPMLNNALKYAVRGATMSGTAMDFDPDALAQNFFVGCFGYHPHLDNGALTTQVGGSHYKGMAVQPAEYCFKNGIGKLEGDVIYYVSRWRDKNGVEDLQKARHTLDILIELVTR